MKMRKLVAALVTGALVLTVMAPVVAAETVPGAVYGQVTGLNKALEKVAEQAKEQILENLAKLGVSKEAAEKQAVEQVKVQVQAKIQEKLTASGVKDVKSTHWAAQSMAIMVEANVLKPDANGEMKPESKVDSNAGIALFAKVLGIAGKDDTAEAATEKAKQAGLISATPVADKPLSRLDTALMLATALGIDSTPAEQPTLESMPFKDSANIPFRHWGIFKKLFELGIFKGFEDGTFQPDQELTVAQIAVLIDRVLGVAGGQ